MSSPIIEPDTKAYYRLLSMEQQGELDKLTDHLSAIAESVNELFDERSYSGQVSYALIGNQKDIESVINLINSFP